MRYSWIILLMVCGALGLEGYRLGVDMDLWDDPRASGVLGVLWALPVMAVLGLVWSRIVPRSTGARLLRSALLFLGTLGLLAASCAPESKFLPYPYVDTCLLSGFDRKSFEKLRTGMSTTEVEAITGPPRFRKPPATWGYLLPGNPDLEWVYSTDNCGWFGDHAWRSYRVGFRDGAVVTVSSVWRYD